MRKLAIAVALASSVLSTPALARDRSPYVGIEGGVMWPERTRVFLNNVTPTDEFDIDYNTGYDVDLIAGYDFGNFRAEAELAHKRAGIDSIFYNQAPTAADGHTSVTSIMVNGLLDYGNEDGVSAYL